VADGGAEAYISPVSAGKRWDACASDALITAAGGRFTDEFGEPIDYRAASLINDRGVVASNGHVHDALLARLAVAREQYQKPT
jgi:3'(2'), 5'-bisphosphate nucleotidase